MDHWTVYALNINLQFLGDPHYRLKHFKISKASAIYRTSYILKKLSFLYNITNNSSRIGRFVT